MTNLPISSKYRSAPQAPVKDVDREELVGQLNEAYSDGSFDADVYQSMLDRVFAAQTMGELAPVASALPVRATYSSRGPATPNAAPPGELTPARPAGQTARIMAVTLLSVAAVVAVLLVLLVALL